MLSHLQSTLLNTVTAIKNGDQIIYEAIFNQYHSKLYYYVFSKTKSTFIAEEVTQLSFIKLWQFKTHLSEELCISIQLFRIAKTTLIDVLRKEAVIVKMQQTKPQPMLLTNHIDEDIYKKELQAKLYTAIYKLPAARRKVFQMSRVDGLSYKEIAEELSLSLKTVEHHIALALKQLRHFMTLSIIFICTFFM